MMGLSYESEPEIRRMQTHFGDVLDIRYAMCVLVDDVRHFMVQEDMAETPEHTLRNYNRRLAGIYRKEEEISGMPIAMEECRLFDMRLAREHSVLLHEQLAHESRHLTF